MKGDPKPFHSSVYLSQSPPVLNLHRITATPLFFSIFIHSFTICLHVVYLLFISDCYCFLTLTESG